MIYDLDITLKTGIVFPGEILENRNVPIFGSFESQKSGSVGRYAFLPPPPPPTPTHPKKIKETISALLPTQKILGTALGGFIRTQ